LKSGQHKHFPDGYGQSYGSIIKLYSTKE